MIRDLFDDELRDLRLAPGAMLLSGFALRFEAPCVIALRLVVDDRPDSADRVRGSWTEDNS